MEDYLTTRQVLDILKVDRITIYRMLQDGRIKGFKIGQQWRFPLQEVQRLVGGAIPQPEPSLPETSNNFPTHCVQAIQDLFSEVGQISALVVDLDGKPLTEVSHTCRFCQVMLQSPAGQAACQASWQECANQSATGSRYYTCHAGLQYISAPILDKDQAIGYFLAGEFYWQVPDAREETDRIHNLASSTNLRAETLHQAADTLTVIPIDQHSRAETWPSLAARTIQSILHERTSFIDRLQQIASLTQFN
jgi:excisionase family DNA binding protein